MECPKEFSQKKSDDYKKLVADVVEAYTTRSNKKNDVAPAWCNIHTFVNKQGEIVIDDKGINICHEINLWTYWQGLGYEKKTPAIKYLVVGQDWGNPFNFESQIMKNIIQMNTNSSIQYLDGLKPKENDTDSNLAELFKILDKKYDIRSERYNELFFTNFCLGYRTGRISGGMNNPRMKEDTKYFNTLCNILKPDNILCLGQTTFDCVHKALSDEKLPYNGKYMDYLDSMRNQNNPYEVAKIEDKSIRIYALAHCGDFGIRNRAGGLKTHEDDWKRIKG
ncbi:MAG: hypothetical protein PHY47_25340 [Lachnospiraceae bacterium]|nr:hypothetical protein [Lachnospiraceae bacterium]